MSGENVSTKLINVTERALKKAIMTRDAEEDAADLALWLDAQPASGFQWAYDLYLDAKSNARPDDVVQQEGDLTLIIPAGSVEGLRGATLDLSRDLLNPGWTVDNPNAPIASPQMGNAAVTPAELEGKPVEEKIKIVLERVINPSIASHGGKAELGKVEGDTAYMVLSGGCQGCGMAAQTLRSGIEVAIKQAVPEIVNVVDATDHESGANPYYA